MSDVDLELGVDTSEAEKSLDNFKSKMTKDLGSLESSFGSLSKIGAAIAAGFAALKIGQFLSDGIKAAAESEAALAKLGNQLKLTGGFSEQALRSFANFADEMERTTNVGDDVILNQAAIVKAFGLTDDQTKDLIRAATELAVLNKTDLATSVDQLIKTYNGQSRALESQIQGVRGLTKEQQAQGEVIRLVNAQLGGTAAAALNTYEGALKSAETAVGNIGKAIGKSFIENQSVVAVIRAITQQINGLEDSLKNNKGTFTAFINGTVSGVFALGEAVSKVFGFIDRAISGVIIVLQKINFGFGELTEAALDLQDAIRGPTEETVTLRRRLEELRREAGVSLETAKKSFFGGENAANNFGKKLAEVRQSMVGLGSQASETARTINQSAQNTKPFVSAEALEKSRQEFKIFSEQIFQLVATETEKVNAKRQEQLDALNRFKQKELLDEREYSEKKIQINESADKQITEINRKESERRVADQKQEINDIKAAAAAAFANPIEYILKQAGVLDLNADPAKKGLTEALSAGAGVLATAVQGEEGAKKFAALAGAGIADSFLPGLGQAIGPLVTALTEDKETIRENTKAFVEALDDVIIGILEGLYVLVQVLVQAIGNAFVRFFQGFATGVGNFFKGLGEFLSGFGKAIGEIFSKIGKFFTEIFGDFGETLGNLFQNIIDGFATIFEGLFSSLGNIGTTIYNAIYEGVLSFVDLVWGVFETIFDAFNSIFEPIFDAINSLIDGVKSVTGGGSGGYLGQIGGKVSSGLERVGIKLAEGGVVPPGFPNDTYPALLTSGERVYPEAMPLPGDEDSNAITQGLLSQILAKLSQPMTVTTTAEVNGRGIADIILQLNRSNARLAT